MQHAAQFGIEKSCSFIERQFKVDDNRIELERIVKEDLAKKMALKGIKEGILSAARVALPVAYKHLLEKVEGK